LNKWLGFNTVLINKTVAKNESNEISEILYQYDPDNFYDQLTNFSKRLFFFISSTNHNPTIDVGEMANVVDDKTEKLFQKLPHFNPYLGFYLNEVLTDYCVASMDPKSNLFRLYKSGSRMSKQQLARSCINIGYVADTENIVVPTPTCTHLMKGLSIEDYFLGSPGSRKGLVDKASETPLSGYLERTLTMALGIVEIIEEDCGTEHGIEFIIFSEKHAKSLVGKYYKDPQDPAMNWEILNLPTARSLINLKILIRSPMTCQTPNFKLCRKCFGTRKLPTECVGVVSGQVVSERLTQLIMRLMKMVASRSNPSRKIL
jgi:hypothetical protein